MSPAAAHPQGSPPGDEELAALYNQVLIGFAEESPTSEQSSHKLPSPGERDYDRAHNQYVNDGSDASRSMQTKTVLSTPAVGKHWALQETS
jgi:RHO1 GDP-GTP exchange protein 1/2